jgi:hypothetical protein
VETEAINQIANEPVFNIIVREIMRLDDLERQSRAGAENTKSDRAKSMYLSEARRAAVSRQNLLVTVGIIPKAPEQIFRVTASLNPEERKEIPVELLTRAEAEQKLIEAMQRSRVLS